MTQEDKDDLELKAKLFTDVNCTADYYDGLQIREDSEYLEYGAEDDIATWEELMKIRSEIANKNFLLEIAETRLHIFTNGKSLNGGVL